MKEDIQEARDNFKDYKNNKKLAQDKFLENLGI